MNEKKQIVKEAKENEELYRFVKSLTREEIKTIKDARVFNELKPNSTSWKIAVMCDVIRSNARQIISTIEKRLINIDDLSNQINRLHVQISTGQITEEIKPGLKMSESELKSFIQTNNWTRTGEVNAIPKALADLRALVGSPDVTGRIVLDEKSFDLRVEDIEKRLKSRGYDLFEELNR